MSLLSTCSTWLDQEHVIHRTCCAGGRISRSTLVQVDLKKVVEHVCDTAGHLLKPRVTLEKGVDPTTPLIAGDGMRIVQVSPLC